MRRTWFFLRVKRGAVPGCSKENLLICEGTDTWALPLLSRLKCPLYLRNSRESLFFPIWSCLGTYRSALPDGDCFLHRAYSLSLLVMHLSVGPSFNFPRGNVVHPCHCGTYKLLWHTLPSFPYLFGMWMRTLIWCRKHQLGSVQPLLPRLWRDHHQSGFVSRRCRFFSWKNDSSQNLSPAGYAHTNALRAGNERERFKGGLNRVEAKAEQNLARRHLLAPLGSSRGSFILTGSILRTRERRWQLFFWTITFFFLSKVSYFKYPAVFLYLFFFVLKNYLWFFPVSTTTSNTETG